MKAEFLVVVTFDEDAIELEARKAGLSLDDARCAILTDVECRLHDSIRYRHAVERVSADVNRCTGERRKAS